MKISRYRYWYVAAAVLALVVGYFYSHMIGVFAVKLTMFLVAAVAGILLSKSVITDAIPEELLKTPIASAGVSIGRAIIILAAAIVVGMGV